MRRAAAFIALLFAAACSGGSSAPSGPPPAPATAFTTIAGAQVAAVLPAIPEVASVNGVASVTLRAQIDEGGRPAFVYQGAAVAPTIRVQPGDTIRLHFENRLPQYCAVGVVSMSNLHFHGLNSAPVAPGDEVISTAASPGAAVDYVVRIGADQPPGLYWYHPHAHGLSNYQVGNGMAGAIVVEGIAGEVPQAAGLRERILVVTDLPADRSFKAIPTRLVATARRPRNAAAACGAEEGTLRLNGAGLSSIGIQPGETQLFRVLNAAANRHLDLAVDGATFALVAVDGVPLRDYPGAAATQVRGDVIVPPGGRAEFLVTGGSGPAALVSHCFDAGSAGDPNPEAVLALLSDDRRWPQAQRERDVVTRVRAVAAVRRSRTYRAPLPAPVALRTIRFEENDAGFYLDGRGYDPAAAPTVVAQAGTTETWTLENDTDEVHAFHIHQVHFVVREINGTPVSDPHWVDTVDVPPQGRGVQNQPHPSHVTVTIDFRDPSIRGTFLYHCHLLEHEDGGMMAKIQVQ